MTSSVRTLAFLAVLGAACSKKREPSPSTGAPPAVPVASAPSSAQSHPAALAVSAGAPAATLDAALDGAPPDDAIEAELVLLGDLELGEGKPLPPPKFTPADKRALEAHAAAIQTVFDAQQKDKCRETSRFNASFVPATYLFCDIAGTEGDPQHAAQPTITRMISVEGTTTAVLQLAMGGGDRGDVGDATPYALWNTPRGYFLDLGDGKPTYVLRREHVQAGEGGEPGTRVECLGKRWSPADGSVTDVAVPTFPTRGRDLDGDGTLEFPAPIFTFSFAGWTLAQPPWLATACNVPDDGRLRLDVGGIDGDDRPRPFHERKLAAARARANRIRASLGLPKLTFPIDGADAGAAPPSPREQTRKLGKLRMSNACALDVAETAAEVYVHGVLSGHGSDVSLADVDAIMRGFALKLGECGGLLGDAVVARDVDHWPELRAALVAFPPKATPSP